MNEYGLFLLLLCTVPRRSEWVQPVCISIVYSTTTKWMSTGCFYCYCVQYQYEVNDCLLYFDCVQYHDEVNEYSLFVLVLCTVPRRSEWVRSVFIVIVCSISKKWMSTACFTVIVYSTTTKWMGTACFIVIVYSTKTKWMSTACFIVIVYSISTKWMTACYILIVYSIMTKWMSTACFNYATACGTATELCYNRNSFNGIIEKTSERTIRNIFLPSYFTFGISKKYLLWNRKGMYKMVGYRVNRFGTENKNILWKITFVNNENIFFAILRWKTTDR